MNTVLLPLHLELGARIVPFGGWNMPVQYSGILAEVSAVRTAAGVFDVSHMGRLHVSGPLATQFLDWVLTGSAETLRVGRARYCMICNESGGVIDDTIFYRLDADAYLVIPNAGNRLEVLAWFQGWIDRKFSGGCSVEDRTESTALIACQGPAALGMVERLVGEPLAGLRPFAWTNAVLSGMEVVLGRTGYTGEDGLEIVADSEDAGAIWRLLLEQGALPCGLGARDVLRLEAGLPLHGHEIDPETTPIEAGLERFVRFDKDYVGAQVLKDQHENGAARRLVGLTTPGRSAPRAGYAISVEGQPVGSVTSGSFSPTLDTSIAMGYVLEQYAQPGQPVQLDIRGRTASAKVVPLPFYARAQTN